MEKIAFIDLEASGLGPASWPIEVGWCFEDGDPEAHLIKPARAWAREAWDDAAEALHGISFENLGAEGRSPEDVCRRLNDTLNGATVFSDAPDWDGFWLFRLFEAGGARQEFSLADFTEVFAHMGSSDIAKVTKRASKIAPHQHRAREDVLHMKTVYEIVSGAADRN